MKKLLCLILMFVFVSTYSVSAYAKLPQQQIEYFENGDYCITSVEPLDNSIMFLSDQISGTKTTTYYQSDNVKAWSITVSGTFSYGNGTAKCLSSSVSTKIYHSFWKVDSKSSSKSSNKATATATCTRYSNGSATSTVTKSVTLTCSSIGKLS